MSNTEKASSLKRGVCKNPECDLCMSHEIQEVEPGADFVCSECGQPLHEMAQKPQKSPVGKYIAIIVAIVVVGLGVYFGFLKGEDKAETPEGPDTTVVTEEGTDTAVVEQTEPQAEPAKEGENEAEGETPVTETGKSAASGTVKLTYGTYTGPLAGGKPNGIGGEFVFTKACTIDIKDGYGNKVEVAPNDKIIATKFENGVLTQGEIHFTDGTRKSLVGVSQKL